MVCPSRFSFVLYNPIRKAFTDRTNVIALSGVTPDSVVLEVGAGNGFLTETLAEHALKVYALELQKGMVNKLQKRVHRFGDKVEIICDDIAAYKVQEAFADICLMYYSFHEVGNKPAAAGNISNAVKGNGLISIFEPTIEVTQAGMKETIHLFKRIGFVEEIDRNGFFTRFARLRKSVKA